MRKLLYAALLLCSTAAVPQTTGAAKPAAQQKCELLPPNYRTDDSKVATEKVGPKDALGPTGNTYFFLPREYRYAKVRIEPQTSDSASYTVKLIARYSDDTIYEPVVATIYPKAGMPLTWGPIELKPAGRVPKGKVVDMFNVKVQSNYALHPAATGFTYKVSVAGCD